MDLRKPLKKKKKKKGGSAGEKLKRLPSLSGERAQYGVVLGSVLGVVPLLKLRRRSGVVAPPQGGSEEGSPLACIGKREDGQEGSISRAKIELEAPLLEVLLEREERMEGPGEVTCEGLKELQLHHGLDNGESMASRSAGGCAGVA